jgi:type IX secretion system substrate protein/PKD domain-containing protein
MLYMTWGRKNGDASNCTAYPVMCTYEGMDSTIRNNYLALASSIHSELSPVSIAWNYIRQNYPGIDLYQPDESHPSPAGSYAAACCFYATIFKKDPTLITFNYSLSATDASIIKNAVKTQVFDYLSLWDFKQSPESDFGYEIDVGVNEVNFRAENLVDTYLWEFGDGAISSLRNPTHSYLSDGTYTVELMATNCDLQGIHTSITDTTISFCSHTPIVSASNPWLCNVDTLWTQTADSYQWFAFNGSNWAAIPETNQYLPDYMQYGNDFTVMTTDGSCSELSQRFFATPASSLYYIETFGVGAASMADTALLIIKNLYGGENIQWYKNSIGIPFETNDTLIITTGGAYHYTITNSNCPLDTTYTSSYIAVLGPTGIEDNIRDPFWSIAPNPVTEILTIKFERVIIEEQIQIYDVTGQLVKEKKTSTTTLINISALPGGVYFIRLKNHNQPALKFIKQ